MSFILRSLTKKKKEPGKKIDFGEYLKKYCPHIKNKENVLQYAKFGEQYLKAIVQNDPGQIKELIRKNGHSLSEVSVCILWCLLRKSYENGKSFGKGTFTICYENDENSALLLRLLQGEFSEKKAKERGSSHYRDEVAVHYGVDKDMSQMEWPWKFKTVVFGLRTENKDTEDQTTSVYFKPETEVVNIKEDPIGTAKHGLNYIKSFFVKQKLDGTTSQRETDKRTQRSLVNKGEEVRFLITPERFIIEELLALNKSGEDKRQRPSSGSGSSRSMTQT